MCSRESLAGGIEFCLFFFWYKLMKGLSGLLSKLIQSEIVYEHTPACSRSRVAQTNLIWTLVGDESEAFEEILGPNVWNHETFNIEHW